jgi:hypothetical protein
MIKRMKQKEQKKLPTLINVAKKLPSKMRIHPLINLNFFLPRHRGGVHTRE